MELFISFGGSHPASIVRSARMPWGEFAGWLTAKPSEAAAKDACGWYCPAEFVPAYRDSENLVARYAITYDFDHVSQAAWSQVLSAWDGLALAIYTTFSHRTEAPRFRVVMPLSRPSGYDEFQAVARKVATDVGIELIARESFVPAQMMFNPARPVGGDFRSAVLDGSFLDVDEVLREYADWTDVSAWPRRVDGDSVHAAAAEKVHPHDKPGPIGDFNRCFSISAAIERFELPYRRVR